MKLWLDRAAAEAEERAQVIHAPGDQMRLAAAGAVAGAAEQIRVALPTLGPPAADLASHVGRGLVRGAAEEVGRQLRLAARSPLVRMVAAPTAACGGDRGPAPRREAAMRMGVETPELYASTVEGWGSPPRCARRRRIIVLRAGALRRRTDVLAWADDTLAVQDAFTYSAGDDRRSPPPSP